MGERTHWIPADAIGISAEQEEIKDTIKDKPTSKQEWAHFTPEFVNTHTPDVDLSSLNREVFTAQKNYQESRISQPDAKIKFDTDLPVTVFFVGDIHYGSIFTDTKKFVKETKEILETPNAYIAFMANLIDNAIPAQYPDSMLNNAIPPDKQVMGMRKFIQELDERGKVLGAVTSPCHEGWTWRHTGQDINALIFDYEGRNFPVMENGGSIKLQFPKSKYNMVLYHQIGPFRSNFNYTHGLKQMNRLRLGMSGDIVAGAHYHCGSVETVYENLGDGKFKPVTYIQSGTYKGVGKINDRWAVDKYGAGAHPTAQSVTVWPSKRRMDAHLDFETGMLAHEAHYIVEMAKRE